MDVNKKINEAIKALQLHDYEKTIKFCKEIILANIDISEVYNLYGLALQKKKLFKDSIEKFKKAIEINLNNFEAYNNLAISLKYTNELNLAEEMYLKCLKINPKFVNGMVNLAKIKVEKKQYEEAIKLLIKSISITPIEYKVFILNQLTYVYSIIGKFNEAKINAEETLKIDKHNIFAIKLLSDLTDHKKNSNIIKKMESMINSSNITEQGISLLAFQLGKAFEQKNDFKKAYNYFDIGNKIKKKKYKVFFTTNIKDERRLNKMLYKL